MRHRLMLGWMFLALLGGPSFVAAQAPTTAPTTQPTADLASIKRMIAQLADDNYQTREAVRVALMGLGRTELPLLREAVKQSLPLELSQTAVLRDIVTQVYLAGEAYEPEKGASGFLGIGLASLGRDEDQGLLSLERGVAVVSRIPGFCAFRELQTGDVILAMISGTRKIEFKSPDPNDLFRPAVMAVGAGQTIHFEVLRQGQIINVAITLARRPRNIDQIGEPQKFTNTRADKAEEMWNRDFAPLLSEPVG